MGSARNRMRILMTVVAVVLAVMAVDCVPRAEMTGLRVVCAVSDASVFVDRKFVGRLQILRDRIVAVPPGTHRIVVRRQGFFPRYRVVTVRRNEVVTVKTVLHRALPAMPPKDAPP